MQIQPNSTLLGVLDRKTVPSPAEVSARRPDRKAVNPPPEQDPPKKGVETHAKAEASRQEPNALTTQPDSPSRSDRPNLTDQRPLPDGAKTRGEDPGARFIQVTVGSGEVRTVPIGIRPQDREPELLGMPNAVDTVPEEPRPDVRDWWAVQPPAGMMFLGGPHPAILGKPNEVPPDNLPTDYIRFNLGGDGVNSAPAATLNLGSTSFVIPPIQNFPGEGRPGGFQVIGPPENLGEPIELPIDVVVPEAPELPGQSGVPGGSAPTTEGRSPEIIGPPVQTVTTPPNPGRNPGNLPGVKPFEKGQPELQLGLPDLIEGATVVVKPEAPAATITSVRPVQENPVVAPVAAQVAPAPVQKDVRDPLDPLAGARPTREPVGPPNIVTQPTTLKVTTENPVLSAEVQAPTRGQPGPRASEKPIEISLDATLDVPVESAGLERPASATETPTVRTNDAKPVVATSQTPALPNEQRERVLNQVADRVEFLAAIRPRGGVTVHLQPQDLGTIMLTVKGRGNEIEAEVSASHDGVRAALEQSRGQLVQNLEHRGLQLQQLTVHTLSTSLGLTADGQAQNAAHGQQATRQAGAQLQHLRPADGSIDIEAARAIARKATGVDFWI